MWKGLTPEQVNRKMVARHWAYNNPKKISLISDFVKAVEFRRNKGESLSCRDAISLANGQEVDMLYDIYKAIKRKVEYHGMVNSSEYAIWTTMKMRCMNPLDNQYHRYGGRGITVCKEWANSFIAFYTDMGKRPSSEYSLERIENDKGYSKSNCKWATKKEQANNMRKNVFLYFNDKRLTMSQLAEELNISKDRVRYYTKKGETGNQIALRFKK